MHSIRQRQAEEKYVTIANTAECSWPIEVPSLLQELSKVWENEPLWASMKEPAKPSAKNDKKWEAFHDTWQDNEEKEVATQGFDAEI